MAQLSGAPVNQLGLLASLLGMTQRNPQIDPQTRVYIQQMQQRPSPMLNPWQSAVMARHTLPNDVPLRNAEHYLFAQQGKGAPSLLSPGYLLYKLLTQPRSATPDPWGQLKWGMAPLFERYNQ